MLASPSLPPGQRPRARSARPQNNLGAALARLGERDGARQEEAVAAYHAALEEWTREVAPHWHDIAQQNLARCLALLEQRRKP